MQEFYVYIVECQSVKPYPVKIGVSSDAQKRLTTLQTASPYKLTIRHQVKFKSKSLAYEFEGFLHREFDYLNIRNEWFSSFSVDDFNDSVVKWNALTGKDSQIKTKCKLTPRMAGKSLKAKSYRKESEYKNESRRQAAIKVWDELEINASHDPKWR